jgi:hypothetical protein
LTDGGEGGKIILKSEEMRREEEASVKVVTMIGFYSQKTHDGEGGSMSTKGESLQVWRLSTAIDTLLSAVSVLVVAVPSSEIPEGLTN